MSTGSTTTAGTGTSSSSSSGVTGNQSSSSQASGAPVTSPTGATGAASPTGATGTTASTASTAKAGVTASFTWPSWSTDLKSSLDSVQGPAGLAVYIWLLVFHIGAGLLSYRRYGSPGWAVLAALFASLYYPYFVFVLDAPAAEPVTAPLIGGTLLMKKIFGMGKSRRR